MITQEVKRKLTAILSADAQGYSCLIGEDENATGALLMFIKKWWAVGFSIPRGRAVDAPDQWQSRLGTEFLASDFYQFSEKPFEDNPDPKFLYLTASNQEIFASILTWIEEGNGFAVITGEAGTGKTFFIHALVGHLDEKVTPILVFP